MFSWELPASGFPGEAVGVLGPPDSPSRDPWGLEEGEEAPTFGTSPSSPQLSPCPSSELETLSWSHLFTHVGNAALGSL